MGRGSRWTYSRAPGICPSRYRATVWKKDPRVLPRAVETHGLDHPTLHRPATRTRVPKLFHHVVPLKAELGAVLGGTGDVLDSGKRGSVGRLLVSARDDRVQAAINEATAGDEESVPLPLDEGEEGGHASEFGELSGLRSILQLQMRDEAATRLMMGVDDLVPCAGELERRRRLRVVVFWVAKDIGEDVKGDQVVGRAHHQLRVEPVLGIMVQESHPLSIGREAYVFDRAAVGFGLDPARGRSRGGEVAVDRHIPAVARVESPYALLEAPRREGDAVGSNVVVVSR